MHKPCGLLMLLMLSAVVHADSAGSAAAEPPPVFARIAPLAAKSLLLHAVRAGQRIVAVGEYGDVLLSDDEGKHWRQAQAVPTTTTLTAVTFVDAQHGWAVGHGGQIIATDDGGENWHLQFGRIDSQDSLFSVWFKDLQRGIAVGPYGYAVETHDGGSSWQPLTIAEGEDGERHLNMIFAGRGGRLFIAAETGAVFVSDDEGGTWRLVALPYGGSIWGGMVRHDGSLLVWGMAGHALLSRDQGSTWSELETHSTQSYTGGAEREDGSVVLVGLGGSVSFGDAKLQFTSVTRPDRQLATSVVITADGVLLFGPNGVNPYSPPP